MEKLFIPSLSKRRVYVMGLAMGTLIGLGIGGAVCSLAHAQELYPTPEIHGTQRDLTHLPQLPFVQVDPTNLQQQMAAQPGVGSIHHYGPLPDLPEPTFRSTPFRSLEHWHPDTDAADRLLEQYRRMNGDR